MSREVHVLNLGAGVQSTTIALLYCRAREMVARWIPRIDVAVFADTQEEPGDVYRHLEWLMAETASRFPTLIRSAGKLGNDLMNGMSAPGRETACAGGERFASIPAYTCVESGVPGGMTKRQCTSDYKVDVIERTIRRDVLGLAPGKRIPSDVAIHQYLGLSYDEPRRIFGRDGRSGAKARIEAHRSFRAHFPLYEMFMSREMCRAWLEKERLPHRVPRSACVCCPYHSNHEWARLKAEDPDGWARAVEIDYGLRGEALAAKNLRGKLYLHRQCVPLDRADLSVSDPKAKQQDLNFSALECEGMCGL